MRYGWYWLPPVLLVLVLAYLAWTAPISLSLP